MQLIFFLFFEYWTAEALSISYVKQKNTIQYSRNIDSDLFGNARLQSIINYIDRHRRN